MARTITVRLTVPQYGALAGAVALQDEDYRTRQEIEGSLSPRDAGEWRALENAWSAIRDAWHAKARS